MMLCATSGAIAAPSWNQLSAGYTKVNVDNFEAATGHQFSGTVELSESLFASASIQKTSEMLIVELDDTFDEFKVNHTDMRFGLGFVKEINKQIDAYFAVHYVSQKDKFEQFANDENGFSAGVGVRYSLTKDYEIGLLLEHIDIKEETDIKVEGEIRLAASKTLAVVGRYARYQDANQFYIGAAYYF